MAPYAEDAERMPISVNQQRNINQFTPAFRFDAGGLTVRRSRESSIRRRIAAAQGKRVRYLLSCGMLSTLQRPRGLDKPIIIAMSGLIIHSNIRVHQQTSVQAIQWSAAR